MENFEQLKLENQLCFPLYTASRLVVRSYTPLLNRLGITYPQYLVLLLMWEHRTLTVSQITKQLYLDTSTITPLLKRLEKIGYIKRTRSSEDERVVMIGLTEAGEKLRDEACSIPAQLAGELNFSEEELVELYRLLYKYIRQS
ncbi:MAG: MarR family transcriptional regulator [Bacteroidales bacterium]|nr:MarR family transcriptional regulator [Bacteroidales bacterium]